MSGSKLKSTWWNIQLQSIHLVCVDGYSSLNLDLEVAFSGRWTFHYLFPAIRTPLICFPLVILLPNFQFQPVKLSPSPIFTVCVPTKISVMRIKVKRINPRRLCNESNRSALQVCVQPFKNRGIKITTIAKRKKNDEVVLLLTTTSSRLKKILYCGIYKFQLIN